MKSLVEYDLEAHHHKDSTMKPNSFEEAVESLASGTRLEESPQPFKWRVPGERDRVISAVRRLSSPTDEQIISTAERVLGFSILSLTKRSNLVAEIRSEL